MNAELNGEKLNALLLRRPPCRQLLLRTDVFGHPAEPNRHVALSSPPAPAPTAVQPDSPAHNTAGATHVAAALALRLLNALRSNGQPHRRCRARRTSGCACASSPIW